MLSILIPAYNEAENLKDLIPKLRLILDSLGEAYEILIVDGGSCDATEEVVNTLGVRFVRQESPGYGAALKEGFRQARGNYIITMDADFSHDPVFIRRMWETKDAADLIIASRYCLGGKSDAALGRTILSVILNRFFACALSIPVKDLSSGYRMYRKEVIEDIACDANDYSFLEELLIKIFGRGLRIAEVPFHYLPRRSGRSHVKLFRFGIAFCRTFLKMWRLRNSIFFADYDERAFNSKIPPQRYWQRRRFKIIMGFLSESSSLLDIGCGTSRIISGLPNAVGMDIELFKLRYLCRKGHKKLVQADIKCLPFKDGAFNTVVCSEVIEHVEKSPENLREMSRVLKDDGELILGTPDYARISWLVIEWLYCKILPNAYGEGHISHYTRRELCALLKEAGFSVLDYKYIAGSELIIKARKGRVIDLDI